MADVSPHTPYGEKQMGEDGATDTGRQASRIPSRSRFLPQIYKHHSSKVAVKKKKKKKKKVHTHKPPH